MNAFERHNITHLFASSLALYRSEPSLWCLKYLYCVRDEAGPAAWRGSAVEAGLDVALYSEGYGDAFDVAMRFFETNDTWLGDVELVLDEAGVYLTFEEAEGKLIALGFDDDMIAEMLTDKLP